MSGNHSRGSTEPVHGTTADGDPVTVSFGTGSAEGETYLADGHQSTSDFWGRDDDGVKNHDHYGSGNGPNNNGTERGKYTGYGS